MKDILDDLMPTIVNELNNRVTAGKFKMDKEKLFWLCEIDESDDPDGDQDAMWSIYCDVSNDLRDYKMYLSPDGQQSYKVEFDAINSWQDNDSCGFDVKVEITAVAITHAAVSAAMEMTSKDVRAPKAVRDGLIGPKSSVANSGRLSGDEAKMAKIDGCPCVNGTKPCDDSCSCVNALSSSGCRACAKYGSAEQRRNKADAILARLDKSTQYAQLHTIFQEVEGEFLMDLFHMVKEFEQSEYSDKTEDGLMILSQEDQVIFEDKLLELTMNRHKHYMDTQSEYPDLRYQRTLNIETQAIETPGEAQMLDQLIRVSMQAGYTHVRDHWGAGAYDEYTIEEAFEKFKIRPQINDDDDLPF